MNKSDFRGFKQVFLFEFMTGVKKTGFKVFVGILCALAFITTPLMTIISNIKGDADSEQNANVKTAIESIYVYNETGLSIDYEALKSSEKYSDVTFITDNGMSYEDAVEMLEKSVRSNDIIVKEKYDSEHGFDVTIVHAGKSDISSSEFDAFEEYYQEFFKQETLKNIGINDTDYEYLSKEINVSVMQPAKDGSFTENTERITYDDYFIMLIGLFIIFMFINMAAGNISTSIATEKSSRVIEYLLTGTRPLALLSGKITARLLETLITLFACYSSYMFSQIVSLLLTANRAVSESASDNIVVVGSIWETITFSKIIISVLYILAGLVLFSIISALAGASVSKLDELQDAYKFYSFLLVGCLYADMFLIIMMLNSSDTSGLQSFFTLFPLTGTFITPALILTGKMSILKGVIALVILIITTVVTFVLASAVYESMLLFQGKRLKAKDIIALMKKQVVT